MYRDAVAKYYRLRGNTVQPPRTNIANLQPWCLISGYQLRYLILLRTLTGSYRILYMYLLVEYTYLRYTTLIG